MRLNTFFLAGAICVFGGLPLTAQDLPIVPSGVAHRVYDIILDVKPDGHFTYARFRFVAPEIGAAGGPTYSDLEGDFQVLCDDYALGVVVAGADPVDRIVISLSDREVEFGYADPDATQYFEAFKAENGVCIWEYF